MTTMVRHGRLWDRIMDLAGSARPTGGRGDFPVQETDFVVVDTELTGLNPRVDSIVSLGAIHMTGTRIDVGQYFYRVARPRSAMNGSSVVVHGITPTETQDAPTVEKLLPEFLAFCGSRVIVGHCVAIDLHFLNTELKMANEHQLKNPVVDTARFYEWIRRRERDACAFDAGTSERMNLIALGERFGIDVSDAHNALSDAFVTAQLFQRLLSVAARHGLRRIGDLLAAARPR